MNPLNVIRPSTWVGWTAVIIVVVLALIAGMADGAHRFLRAAAWILVALVAVVATINSGKGN